jgi:hypothetical protein
MSQRNAAVLVASLALALCAWALTRVRHSEPALSVGREMEQPRVEPRDDSPRMLETEAAQSASEPSVALDAFSPPRTALSTEGDFGHELTLVAGAQGAPVAGARVHYADLNDAQVLEWFAGEDKIGSAAHRIEREGRELLSDEGGRVRVPRLHRHGLVIAQQGELFGLWWIREQRALSLRLQMESGAAWDVRVRDTCGQPIADVPIDCLTPSGKALMSVRTDADGRARFGHAAWVLARGGGREFELVPRALLRKPASFRWDQRVPPSTPTELVLPELGFAQVRLGESDPALSISGAQFAALHGAGEARSSASERKQQIAHLSPSAADAQRIHVELGMPLEASWRAAGVSAELTARADGPRATGEIVRLELAMPSSSARFRLLGVDGKPLANTRVRVRSLEPPLTAHHSTDARGALCIPLDLPLNAAQAGVEHVLSIAPRDAPGLQAELRVPASSAQGVLELGDVQLAARALPSAKSVARVASLAPRSRTELEWFDGELTVVDAFGGAPARLGAAHGQVLLPVELRPTDFEVRLSCSSDPHAWAMLALDHEGRWRASRLPLGSWSIDLVPTNAITWPAHDPFGLAEFEIASESWVEAPSIDLRPLRMIELSAVDELGRALGAYAEFDTSASNAPARCFASDGRWRVLTHEPILRACFEASGRRRECLTPVQDGATAVLGPGFPLRVRLSHTSVSAAHRYELLAWLESRDEPVLVDRAGEAELHAATPGAHQLLLALRDPSWAGTVRRQPLGGSRPVRYPVNVPSTGELSVLEIELEPELVADAVRRIEGA